MPLSKPMKTLAAADHNILVGAPIVAWCTYLLFGIPRSEKPSLYVLGVAWDGSSTYRRGACEGPRTIREATSGKLYNSFTEDLTDLREFWSYMDLGDVSGADFKEVESRVLEAVQKYYSGEVFLFLGGDHSITYAAFKALKAASGRDFGLIYFDAHPDLYPSYDSDPYSHACTVRRLIEEEVVSPEEVVVVGVRAPTKEQVRFAEERGIRILSTSEVRSNPRVEVSFERAYLSFDLDVLDPAYAPGVGNPEPGGLSTRELIDVIKLLKVSIVAFDVVEIAPRYDCGGITAFAAAKIIREVLGLSARTSVV